MSKLITVCWIALAACLVWRPVAGQAAPEPGAPPQVAPKQVVMKLRPRPLGAARQLKEQAGTLSLPPLVAVEPAPPKSRPTTTRPVARPVAPSAAPDNLVLRKTTPVLEALPSRVQMVRVPTWKFGIAKDISDQQGQGPSPSVLDLAEGLRADGVFAREFLSRLSSRIFQDQNPASGLLYFLPRSYALDWAEVTGYGLRMLYGASSEPGEAGEVMMAARLGAGVDAAELSVARALMAAYSRRHPQTKFVELRPLPIEKPPEISLAGELSRQYEIPAEKIAVAAISDVLGEVDVSWVTDTVTKENLQLALIEELGINGTVTFTPAGGALPPQSIPVHLRLAHPETFGRMLWRRGQSWRNTTPYPIHLRYLHALLLEGNSPVVYSWSLESPGLQNLPIPPGGRAEIDGSTVPSWLDGRSLAMWLEPQPDGSCEACDQAVVAEVTGGVTSLGSSEITFHTITPLADLGAYEISVTVRSRYFDARTRQLRTQPTLPLSADHQDFRLGPIYLINRQPGESVPQNGLADPLFEYLLEVTMPDGRIHRATRWIPSDNLRVLVGKVQVEQALGTLPSAPGAPP